MRGPQDEKLTAFDEETPTCRTQRSTPRARASPPRATPRACARIEWRPRNRQAQARNVDKPVAVPRSGPKAAVVAATSVSGSSETRRLVESAILFSEPGI